MLSLNHKTQKKVNPKRQKRQELLEIGKPKAPPDKSKKLRHEKLSDWEDAS